MDELSDPDTAPCDMIIGIDLLKELAMDQRFSNQTIVWDDLTVPMHTNMAYVLATEALILKLAEERQNMILDVNYVAIDLDI